MNGLKAFAVATAILGSATAAAAQEHQDVNDANNPLTPKITFNLQDYYVPSFIDVPGHPHANQFLLRGLVPSDMFGVPQLLRFTLPIATSPEVQHGYVTGLGDLTLMDIFILPKMGDVTFGAGPLVVAPTATDRSLGNGKWQAGGAGIVVAPQDWGLLAALATYQTSFAGQHDREDVNLLTVQPIVNVNLKDGWYLRSTATWNFNLENGASYIPVGLGVGKVFQLDKGVTMNAFVEPQYTVWNDGAGAPRWQIFAGVNFQFPIHRPAQ
ncbi:MULTISPECIES: hypothetical protein [unclassified Rhizobium]|uniref:hypothetical protein n=1 Tax=unclassified Rhizobium TaxID=2613769 RepID=UPI001ADA835B|nr:MULTISPECIES: hypothetical protein [unclassified Rhizobium]MBO9100957.1 hypothetical protein [Rhizobium sp. L58/93]MBO9170727.1 hypothetical protein [Rhizobium sp. L245/93]MBO9186550.1 hypothetical protein [Rhizobium sp. E27B/91]QXZ86164.1 hypothetical protein J5287_24085 [Rhizobium sp. K1/93]QXZ92380.1 hypothetical protein J5280_25105 [Rhizobium sp. K15/93]